MELDNKRICETFGEYIRDRRLDLGLYQREVAEDLGITQTYYSLIERGERDISMGLTLAICRVLNINFATFLKTLPREFTAPEKRGRRKPNTAKKNSAPE